MEKEQEFTLCTDGGSRGNPGPAAIGIVILDHRGRIIVKKGEYVSRATNNEAEYTALLAGLELVSATWKGPVQCISDSELMVRQLNGEYQVRAPGLKPLHNRVLEQLKAFQRVTFKHVKRSHELVKIADGLVNEALSSIEGKA